MPDRYAGEVWQRDPEFLALRDTISFAEGTWDEENNRPGYAYRYGDSPGSGGSLDITAPHPIQGRPSPWGGSSGSNASGAYQFLDSTWSEMNNNENVVMSPNNQDRSLHRLLVDRVGYDFDKPFNEQINTLAPTWASFPNAQGVSNYGQPVKKASMLTDHYQTRLQHHKSKVMSINPYQPGLKASPNPYR